MCPVIKNNLSLHIFYFYFSSRHIIFYIFKFSFFSQKLPHAKIQSDYIYSPSFTSFMKLIDKLEECEKVRDGCDNHIHTLLHAST